MENGRNELGVCLVDEKGEVIARIRRTCLAGWSRWPGMWGVHSPSSSTSPSFLLLSTSTHSDPSRSRSHLKYRRLAGVVQTQDEQAHLFFLLLHLLQGWDGREE